MPTMPTKDKLIISDNILLSLGVNKKPKLIKKKNYTTFLSTKITIEIRYMSLCDLFVAVIRMSLLDNMRKSCGPHITKNELLLIKF